MSPTGPTQLSLICPPVPQNLGYSYRKVAVLLWPLLGCEVSFVLAWPLTSPCPRLLPATPTAYLTFPGGRKLIKSAHVGLASQPRDCQSPAPGLGHRLMSGPHPTPKGLPVQSLPATSLQLLLMPGPCQLLTLLP